MAFDSGMLRCVCTELECRLSGGKIEKVLQPEKDEINLVVRSLGKSERLLISASSNSPRICITSTVKENPESAYMLCMLLRKHLVGARLLHVEQIGFERIVRLSFDCGDEMGYRRNRFLYLELMGRNSTMVFCDENDKILATTRLVDLTSSAERKLLPGMPYEFPPSQGKRSPVVLEAPEFYSMYETEDGDLPAARWLVDRFEGISPLVARECVFLACGDVESTLGSCDKVLLFQAFRRMVDKAVRGEWEPCILYRDEEKQSAFEFCFLPIMQYGSEAFLKSFGSPGEAIDSYYSQRDRAERKKQHYNDIYTVLKNARNRVKKKLLAQEKELEDAEKADWSKTCGDLIMQELYRIHKGDTKIEAVDYTKDPPSTVEISLDPKLPPSANAQRYYKEYGKKNVAKERIRQQMELASQEEAYLDSVLEALSRASTEADYSQIRTELSLAGYGKRGVAFKAPDKRKKARPDEYLSPNGFKVLVGRNNTQNDVITFDLAAKDDVWFHAKDYHGAHVLLVTNGAAPANEDLEFAARLAAGASGASESRKAAVDYTLARYVKKPSGGRPGFVNYFRYTTVYVVPLKNQKTP